MQSMWHSGLCSQNWIPCQPSLVNLKEQAGSQKVKLKLFSEIWAPFFIWNTVCLFSGGHFLNHRVMIELLKCLGCLEEERKLKYSRNFIPKERHYIPNRDSAGGREENQNKKIAICYTIILYVTIKLCSKKEHLMIMKKNKRHQWLKNIMILPEGKH